MQITDILRKLNIYGSKIVLIVAVATVLGVHDASAQKVKWLKRNNPNYDDRKLSYGFLIGIHSSTLQLQYSDEFVTPAFDTVYAVRPEWSGGFSLGFIVNYKAEEFLDLRLTPKVAFYEHSLSYEYTNAPTHNELIESTMVEFPFLAKYKSMRRGNVRMYMIGGITPGVEASGKKDVENATRGLELKKFNLQLEAGFGLDLYYPLFKFSPEIRFSRGLTDVLGSRNNEFGQPLRYINTNTVTVYLLFQ